MRCKSSYTEQKSISTLLLAHGDGEQRESEPFPLDGGDALCEHVVEEVAASLH